MSKIKIIIRWIVNILTCFLLLVLFLVIYGKCVLIFSDKGYPNYFGYTFFEVASGSMEPALCINDVILVNITKDNLEKNDIIAFSNNNAIITHRILFIDGDTITVKGDHNNVIDAPINRSQVIGKVVKVLPKFGIWKKVITEPKILIVIFITLILFDFALSYNGNDKRKIVKEKVKEVREEKKEISKEVSMNIDKKKDIIEADKLLELTRKIDISEINNLIENENIKLSNKEITGLKKELSNTLEKTQELPVLKEKEKKFLEYTMRLDLNEIQKKIKSKVK